MVCHMQGQGLALSRLTENQSELQRHIRITAAVLADTDAASFHAVSDSFPQIPNLEVGFISCHTHMLHVRPGYVAVSHAHLANGTEVVLHFCYQPLLGSTAA